MGKEHKKIILKSDQEPSIIALRDEIIKQREEETIPEESQVAESQSNGPVERAVQTIQGQTRTMKDDVPEETKKERLKLINVEQERIATKLNDRFKGEIHEVLVEGKKNDRWFGRNRNDKLVFFDDDETAMGDMVSVKIDETSPWFLQGSLVQNNVVINFPS